MARAWKNMHWNLFQWSNLGDQNWVFAVINYEIQLLPNINWFWVKFFFHMVQYVVCYNFHVYKFGFYPHKNMLWLFEWKQSPRVLGFVGHCISTLLTANCSNFEALPKTSVVWGSFTHSNYGHIVNISWYQGFMWNATI
jgi:hypothetical protein